MLQLDLEPLQLCWLVEWLMHIWGLDCPEINPVPVAYQRLNGSWVCAAGYAGSVQAPTKSEVTKTITGIEQILWSHLQPIVNDVPQSHRKYIINQICLSKTSKLPRCPVAPLPCRWIATSAATALRNRAWKDATRRTQQQQRNTTVFHDQN